MKIVFVPHPVSGESAATCRAYVEGNDPLSGLPVIDSIINVLTGPLREDENKAGFVERPSSRLIGPDTPDNLHQLFLENGWTDKLPIVLPTEEKVAEMLKGTSRKPGEKVGEMRAGYESLSYTVEQVAANAVMAGAKPEYMPVILAMAASRVPALFSSTQSFARMLVINGPIRKEIGMNSGCGALSPVNHANAVLGRAATLMAINLGGGGVPKLSYWGSQGNNLNYNNVTFAENEEELPEGWKPFHVQKGFREDESVISFFHGYSLWHFKNTFDREHHKAMLRMAGWNLPSGNFRSGFGFLLDPLVAQDLVKEGFQTKEALSTYIYENCRLTLEEYWQYHLIEGLTLPAAEKGVEPYAAWLKLSKDTLIHRYLNADEISAFVVGGQTNKFWQAGDWRYMGSFSIDDER